MFFCNKFVLLSLGTDSSFFWTIAGAFFSFSIPTETVGVSTFFDVGTPLSTVFFNGTEV